MSTNRMNDELPYLEYFGLAYNPFPVAPDNENFYLSEHIDQILSDIVHGVITRKGFMVLTGEIGLGKTTISRRIISILEEKGVETSLILHTFYQDVDLLREINRDFGLEVDQLTLPEQMGCLNNFLIEQNRKGKNCTIIIDDAQNLTVQSLELIRMISNLETDKEKLVQILLIGQPELMDTLSSSEMRQLRSRVIIREEAQPLSQEELKDYVLFKLNAAGNTYTITILDSAFRKIHRDSKGNFRMVNNIMDRCLYVAFLYNTTTIDKSIVDEAYEDLKYVDPRNTKRIFVSALCMILILFAIGGTFAWGLFSKARWLSADTFSERTEIISDTEKGEINLLKEKFSNAKNQKKRDISEAVMNFLSAYRLESFEEIFFEAINTGFFSKVADSIFEKTGYQLIQLTNVPENIRDHYGILSCSFGEQKISHFLFWKPSIQVKKFYIGYQGDEIKKLEKLLAQTQYYSYFIDGIVGQRLMWAVNHFQEAKKLDITGFPDNETIFLLCNEKGVI